jgi:tetratricopeptide (TPR) repeat protein
MRALILLSDKDPQGAIQAADSALRYDRTLAQAEYIKANALIETGQYDDALTSLDTSVRQNPMLGGAQTHSLRGRIYFKQRKVKQSYGEFLVAQRLSGRAVRLAPLMAAIAMVLSVFGSRAPFVLAGVLAVIVTLILWGVSHIPVAGPWLVVALIIAIVGAFAFGGVRQLGGSVLPHDPSAKATALAAIGVALLAGTGIILVIEYAIANATHQHQWFTPLTMTIAGVIGVALGGLAAYNWPRVLGRFGAAGAAKA